jgi:hypothetical protein
VVGDAVEEFSILLLRLNAIEGSRDKFFREDCDRIGQSDFFGATSSSAIFRNFSNAF